jgi:hypothetical protein
MGAVLERLDEGELVIVGRFLDRVEVNLLELTRR